MATYVIGDVQGCYDDLRALLNALKFKADADQLWFVGDLINRGPKDLKTLRFVRDLGEQAQTVLGNHDLHLLAIYFGGHQVLQSDTFGEVLDAPDCEELANWLRCLPFLIENGDMVMTHAGIPHIWNLTQAKSFAREIEEELHAGDFSYYFEHMYGNKPRKWNDSSTGMDRLRSITNYFTRMRFIKPDGKLEFRHKGPAAFNPDGYSPWFDFPSQVKKTQYFGHWASLDGKTGQSQIIATDTGCVWGRGLTAVRVSDQRRFTWIEEELFVSE